MRADRDNAVKYLGSWLVAVAAVWSVLMLYGKENPWIDRVIFGEIAICGVLVILFILRYTPEFKARNIGVFSMFFGIVVLYLASQLLAAGAFGEPIKPAYIPPGIPRPPVIPYWWRCLGRSMLAVAGPLVLWGYYHYVQDEPNQVA